ncbi:MAG TPA: CPBP family intramembrane glutamic endopeptidase [Actinocrinis sp.]|jgi:membrane protease YdiL (CAAX protease family)
MASASEHRRSAAAPRHTLGTRPAIAVTVGLLVLANLFDNRWVPGWNVVAGPVTAALLLGVWFWSGGTWAQAGLGRAGLGTGARWALALIGIVAAVYLVGGALPFTRELFADRRTSGLSGLQVANQMLLQVPIGTVLQEETAFRGVLLALLLRRYSRVRAVVVSSVLFGLWHVLPSLHLSTDKPAFTRLFGSGAVGAAVVDLGAVLFTAAAGAVLCELRGRSRSLLAPMGLHWATNALGYLAAYLLG